jgi:hypothetical protein
MGYEKAQKRQSIVLPEPTQHSIHDGFCRHGISGSSHFTSDRLDENVQPFLERLVVLMALA